MLKKIIGFINLFFLKIKQLLIGLKRKKHPVENKRYRARVQKNINKVLELLPVDKKRYYINKITRSHNLVNQLNICEDILRIYGPGSEHKVIKKCPKCGGNNREIESNENGLLFWGICYNCEFESKEASTKLVAIRYWNHGLPTDFRGADK